MDGDDRMLSPETASSRRQQRIRLTLGVWIDHAKAIRIPLFILLAGIVMTFWVDQIHELFLLLCLTDHPLHQVGAVVMGAGLGAAMWHTTRTVYRFDVPSMPLLASPRGAGIRKWAPRILGASVPLLMMAGTLSVRANARVMNFSEAVPFVLPIGFFVEAALLFAFFVARRRVFRGVSTLKADPADDARVTRWSQLPDVVRMVYASIVLLNVAAILCVKFGPGELSSLGCLSVILLCAGFFTVTGTLLTIQGARWEFPLLSALLIEAVVLQWLGANDNHHVRLYRAMNSDDVPKAVPAAQVTMPSFEDYLKTWDASSGKPVYIVSAEGGGIRAAAWTAVVLTELERRSGGEFSRRMLMGSGISGGSLGLAFFGAVVNGERRGVLQSSDIQSMTKSFNESDFLGPMIETMFLTDFLQRFVPHAVFIDRGQRLEDGWRRAWLNACRQRPSLGGRSASAVASADERVVCDAFGEEWDLLWQHHDVPALFFNSTQVDTGERFVQHPFNHLRSNGDDSLIQNAAVLSTGEISGAAPLSAVVHNSARFTYVSPAGTLVDTSSASSVRRSDIGQLVDGGYFENSGTTTLAELLKFALRNSPTLRAACAEGSHLWSDTCPIRLIHISNDPGIESMRSDDACPTSAPARQRVATYGEARAPLMALLNTRDARGAAARASIRALFAGEAAETSTVNESVDKHVYHFRLCNGEHHLPLGWTLSPESMDELGAQLNGRVRGLDSGPDKAQFESVLAALRAP